MQHPRGASGERQRERAVLLPSSEALLPVPCPCPLSQPHPKTSWSLGQPRRGGCRAGSSCAPCLLKGSKRGPLGTPRPFLHPRNRNSGVLGARRTISLPQGHAGQPRCRPGVPTVGDGWDAAFATPAVLAQVHRPGRGRAAAASPSCFFASFLLVKSWATRGERSPRQAARWGCVWVLAARSCPRSAPRARLSSARPRVPLSPNGAPRDRGFVPSPGPAHAGVPARERRQRHHGSPSAPGAPLWAEICWVREV